MFLISCKDAMFHQAIGNGKASFTYAELKKIMEPGFVFYIT